MLPFRECGDDEIPHPHSPVHLSVQDALLFYAFPTSANVHGCVAYAHAYVCVACIAGRVRRTRTRTRIARIRSRSHVRTYTYTYVRARASRACVRVPACMYCVKIQHVIGNA